MSEVREVVVLSAVRTAIGDFGGSLKTVEPSTLAAITLKESVARSGIEPAEVGMVVMGTVVPEEERAPYTARIAQIEAGIPCETSCVAVNRLCGSGMQAIVDAAQGIMLGDYDVAIGAGVESMSNSLYALPGARWGQKMGAGQMIDLMISALTDPFGTGHMGMTAENLADKYNISREDQDALAVMSHQNAARAQAEGRFDSQIVPVEIKTRKGVTVFDKDEHVRPDISVEKLSGMRPAFKKDGSITAGNASGINDASSAMVLMAKEAAEARGLKPMAKLVAYSHAGVEPEIMGIGPVPAVEKILSATGLTIGDIDVFEVNEAFAAQALSVCRELDLPMDKVNVNGSGISLGHPIGASANIIVVKALHELERVQGKYALATLCIGGGQGIATLWERM
ncbi:MULTISPECIES: beta-ketothiolase BktB [Cycloclasticus]|jgi:acetyl-CoA C-acetyltransferase|uniref:Acetyl-CoA C-acetyltransferase n=1 Tax=Cycloclasticus zancles 78-ME TaxID=1198232 RepID=S5TZ86_9GAMM|nr:MULTISPECIES: beta-ketothiolase BktB [Cycloclasticus]AGS40540.1 Acetyl-CoA C-acetyltransferase [Cycloclasticus zancles 78-ME]MDF1829666.1 beta-ketothiolase BktB [Cycloclasticus pugetii]